MLPQRRSVEAAVANMLIWLNTNLRSASHSLTRFGFFRTVLLAAENEQDGAVCVVSRGGGVCAPGGLLQLVAAAGMVVQGSDWSDLGSAGCPMGLWTTRSMFYKRQLIRDARQNFEKIKGWA